jgi:cytochrome c oxidase subunit II
VSGPRISRLRVTRPPGGTEIPIPPTWRALALVPVLAGCSGPHNALDPRGPQAARIAEVWWVMFVLGVAVFVGFSVVFAIALRRARRNGEANDLPPSHARALVLWGGVLVPLVVLAALVVFSTVTDRRLASLGNSADDLLTITVTGHQFWWDLRYRDRERPFREFRTANELHIPVGRPVRIEARSADVIHSFWIPNLHGKIDMIPGRENELIIQADEPGVFIGQCAEFCGTQHAKMRLAVVARPAPEFDAWWDGQLVPSPPPAEAVAARGQQVFMQTGCSLCHAIRGTDAWAARPGPDLTYFGARRSIAAGWLANNRGNLGAWLVDPQGIKPGSHMFTAPIGSEDLQALIVYLQSLR